MQAAAGVLDAANTTYTVPDNPPDPEAAALELIVRLPADLLGHDWPLREVLQEFTTVLVDEATKGTLENATVLTIGHLLIMGPTTRANGLHRAAVTAIESDNPFAAFTLIRAYAENAAAVVTRLRHHRRR